ncbi:hypothetical protein [Flavobacterium ovatum]|uniref:hypothetical protein n=1 Tax=Flavobacterium ovatum TaxID=1928857 RepID=UPI00344CCE7A
MKTIKLLQLFLLSSLLFSCTEDEPVVTPMSNNFTVNATDFATPHAYLIYDEGSALNNRYFLTFSNAPLIQETPSKVAVQTTMTQAAVLYIENVPVPISSGFSMAPVGVGTHTLDTDDTEVLNNIVNFDDPFVSGGLSYGQPSYTGANLFQMPTGGIGTVTINAITIDTIAGTGTINCTYQMTSSSGDVIIGNYSGTFEIRSSNF